MSDGEKNYFRDKKTCWIPRESENSTSGFR
jgi:hypothetical protein